MRGDAELVPERATGHRRRVVRCPGPEGREERGEGSPGGVGSSWAQAGRGSRVVGRHVRLILGAVTVERREREEKGGLRERPGGRSSEAGGGGQRKEAHAARLGGGCLLGLGPLVRLGFSFFLFFYFLFLNSKSIFK
jgi:hypothetical protein